MQITNILIWQVDKTLRNFKLKENKVNVITGDSGKGKSSILAIIDYCLLSSSSDGISKTSVDNHVHWYGIRFKLNDSYHTICRKATHIENDGLVYFDKSGAIPDVPENNIKIQSLKEQLNLEFGIDGLLQIPYGGKTIKQGSKVSYRYFIPHCFIDQDTLASSGSLYSKFSKEKIKERVERTYDMALGCEDAKTMIIRTRVEELQKRLAKLEYKQTTSQETYLNFEDEINKLYRESYSLGLIAEEGNIQLEVNEKFKSIEAIIHYKDINELPIVNEKIKLEEELFLLKRELKAIEDFIISNTDYKKSLKESQDSLLIAKYLNENYERIVYSQNIYSIVSSLLSQSLEINTAIKQKESNSLIAKTMEKKKELEKYITEIEGKLDCFSPEKNSSPNEIYRFIGKLESELSRVQVIPKQSYIEDIEETNTQIDGLEKEISNNKIFKEYTINLLNNKMKDIFVRMPLEGYQNAVPMFNKIEKMVDIINNGQVEKMIDVGSASNYMYLHVAYFLALHELVRERNIQWMPRFLVIDQPSTPYFSSEGKKTNDFDLLDAALSELNSFVSKMDAYNGFQIILLEHIEEKYWLDKKLENFNLVDKEFRGDYGLICFSE